MGRVEGGDDDGEVKEVTSKHSEGFVSKPEGLSSYMVLIGVGIGNLECLRVSSD